MLAQLRQSPLRDRNQDRDLFVPPEPFTRGLWAVEKGFNLLVLGERGQGKTSVLHQLQLALRQAQPERPVAFVDLAGAASVGAALGLLVSAAGSALGRLLSWTPPLPVPNESEEERNVRGYLDQLAVLEPCTFLIDNVRASEVGFPLFGVLRDRLWETPHQWVVSGEKADRRFLLRPPADAFWEEAIEIEYTVQAAHELLERRLDNSPAWIGPIVDNVGTNPRQLLQAALAAARGDDEATAVVQAWEEWHNRLASLDSRSSTLMAELSGRPPVSASDPELLSTLGWARTSLIKTLEDLESQGLVESWNEPAGTGRPKRLFTTRQPGRPRHG